MKAILAVACIFSAVVLISALEQEVCEAPRATPQCAPNAPVVTSYYYNNGTRQCEKDVGCSNGPNNFPSEGECKEACPYGKYASNRLISQRVRDSKRPSI
uniref:Putative salivary kunitz domain protein n=1 Tax=Ixodes ricinus TaxID=34613 RepID=A0A0K8RLR8_IXORI